MGRPRPKPVDHEPVVRGEPEAVGTTSVPAIQVKAATTQYPVYAISWTGRVFNRGLGSLAVFPFVKPICAPLPHIAGHVSAAIEAVAGWRILADRGGIADPRLIRVAFVPIELIPPRINSPVGPPRCLLPLSLGGKAVRFAGLLAQPFAASYRILPGYIHHRVVALFRRVLVAVPMDWRLVPGLFHESLVFQVGEWVLTDPILGKLHVVLGLLIIKKSLFVTIC